MSGADDDQTTRRSPDLGAGELTPSSERSLAAPSRDRGARRWQAGRGAVLAASVALALAVLLPGNRLAVAGAGSPGSFGAGSRAEQVAAILPSPLTFTDATGAIQTISTTGSFDDGGPFFQNFGSNNGRDCLSCHREADGWGLSASHVQKLFRGSGGTDPIFLRLDGANSPLADVSTVQARRTAYSMLIKKALNRIDRPMPASAEFSLVAVDDPYGYASAQHLSLFRRPLPATNLNSLTLVMWDGRETPFPLSPLNTADQNMANLLADLQQQAGDATLSHALAVGVPPSAAVLRQVVAFEMATYTAQLRDKAAKNLTAAGGLGGPVALSTQPFYVGVNDSLGGDPTGAPFNPVAMTLYDAWASPTHTAAQQSVARGQSLFNTFDFDISGVAGLNDDPAGQQVIHGTCTTCHDTPNVGSHSISRLMNVGTSDGSRRTRDMPLYTLQNNATLQTITTTDPLLAVSTGRWADIGRVKVPGLRGLAARAPYFHDGSAAGLSDVVVYFLGRFNIQFTAQQQADLVAFLQAL